MKRIAAAAFSVGLIFALFADTTRACTTFCLKARGENIFGRNYDWDFGDGMIIVNKRGVAKSSMVENEKKVLGWVSKYGSITFNQYGRENPMGGINERNLVIELMWLDETKYPAADSRPAVDVLEWIQYQLDTAATTAEVIAHSGGVRISSKIPLHYLVNDREGNSATIEFLEGKLVLHTGTSLPVATLANSSYDQSLGFAAKTDLAKATSSGSLDRFVRASAKTKDFGKKEMTESEAIAYAFDTLATAAQNGTQWSIVYDQKRSKIHFRTKLNNEIRTIDTRVFDYGCGSPVMILDANAAGSGDVTKAFAAYTRTANRDLIERSFSKTDFTKNTPAAAKDQMAAYPESFGCTNVPQAPVKTAVSGTFAAGMLLQAMLAS